MSGGYPQPFEADGSFWVDAGVARFRIILSGDWTLTPPSGSGLNAASAAKEQSWAVTTAKDSATVIDVATGAAASQGKWKLQAGDTKSLFFFSDLGIRFDPKNAIGIGADGKAAATLRAQVTKADGSAGGLTQYQEHTFTARLVDADGLVTSLPAADVDAATGAISIPIPSTVSAANVVVEASIDPLRTQHSTLAPVTTRQDVATVLPAQFPSITSPLPVTLGALEGSQGTATGEIEVAGPTAGGNGNRLCLGRPHRHERRWPPSGRELALDIRPMRRRASRARQPRSR